MTNRYTLHMILYRDLNWYIFFLGISIFSIQRTKSGMDVVQINRFHVVRTSTL